MKEKILVGENVQQIPNNNNVHRMLMIIISLKPFSLSLFVILSYRYQIPTMSITNQKGHKTEEHGK